MRKLFALFFMCAGMNACNNTETDRGNKTEKPDVLASNIDSTVDPSADFFLYANGGWIKKIQYLVNNQVGVSAICCRRKFKKIKRDQ